MYTNLLIAFLIICAIRILSNAYKYYRCSKLMTCYLAWLESNYPDEDIFQTKYEVTKLLSVTPDKGLALTLPTGLGQGYTANHSTLFSYPNRNHPFATATYEMFAESKGVYKTKVLETFNPLFWIDLIVWLPRKFLSYLGINESSFASRLLMILLQAIYWLCSLIAITFKEDIQSLLLTFITSTLLK